MDKPTIFISYSHQDEVWKDRLRPHLQALALDDRIVVWDDRKIDAGDTWYPEIKDAINRARVAVCLISADFLASKFCVKEEIPVFLQRRETEGVVILPVLVRPCFWKKTEWLSQIQMLPRDGKSLAADFKEDFDTVFAELAERIFEVIDNPDYQPPSPPAPIWAMPEKLDTSRLPVTGSELFGRQAQLELLDEAWDSVATNVVSFVAWGGVGKSTLINKWLERLAKDNYRGAERVYAWSFYSQGTTERATSADLFINSALEWFGDEDPSAGSPWDKGERLARLIRQHRTLLLLDGMEPLQSANSFERGKIKDPALATLVTELARGNPGLCIITTREHISDLDHQFGMGKGSDWVLAILNPSAARGADAVRQINLELLSPEAGRALLRVGGVRGTDEELERAAKSFGCHALALNLLAIYLQDIPGHHVSAAAQIPDLDIPEAEGKHPRRMIAAFERKLGEGPELEVLRVLGLFDRPADGASLAALRKAPKISDLTDHISEDAEAAWLRAVQKLRKLKLIAEESHHGSDELDAHPLVREHFGQQMKRDHPDAWRAANLRLYEHLTITTKEFPDTLEEMQPLFDAVAHGCAAGLQQQTFREVYWRRIRRENEAFSIHKLGAFGIDLAVLSSFFDGHWRVVSSALTEADQAFVLNSAGFRLRALGYLQEAVQPMQHSLVVAVAQADWKNAAISAGNLSELALTLGDLSKAITLARQGVELADLSSDSFMLMVNRTALSEALHHAGYLKEAVAEFYFAEAQQQENQPEFPLLYALQGFRYCDLLVSLGQFQEAQTRATQMQEWGKIYGGLLTTALDHLALGRVSLGLEQQVDAAEPHLALTADWLHLAVDGLRKAGDQTRLPLGLLARAEWARVAKQFDQARRDLAEAFTIAERGEMRLHLADCYLEFARLSLATGDRDSARKAWETAKAMIEEMEYHRRDGEVAALAAELGMTKAE
ncbi:MAG: TIR domain-containing protein [Blastocatellales bacterium]